MTHDLPDIGTRFERRTYVATYCISLVPINYNFATYN